MNTDRYRKERLSISSRIAQSIVGIIFCGLFLFIIFNHLKFLIENEVGRDSLETLALVSVFLILLGYFGRLTYHSVCGYRISPTPEFQEIKQQRKNAREETINEVIRLVLLLLGILTALAGVGVFAYQPIR